MHLDKWFFILFSFYPLPRMVKEVYSKCNCAFGFVMYFSDLVHIILILFKSCHCIVSISFPAWANRRYTCMYILTNKVVDHFVMIKLLPFITWVWTMNLSQGHLIPIWFKELYLIKSNICPIFFFKFRIVSYQNHIFFKHYTENVFTIYNISKRKKNEK